MSSQKTASADAKQKLWLFFTLACVLIAEFLWDVFTPAHQLPLRTEQVMTMALNAGMVIGLYSVKNSGPKPLWWIAMIAGVGLFAIRLTGNAARNR
jgi:hypothetical protein